MYIYIYVIYIYNYIYICYICIIIYIYYIYIHYIYIYIYLYTYACVCVYVCLNWLKRKTPQLVLVNIHQHRPKLHIPAWHSMAMAAFTGASMRSWRRFETELCCASWCKNKRSWFSKMWMQVWDSASICEGPRQYVLKVLVAVPTVLNVSTTRPWGCHNDFQS